jgi:hypothetical protein
MAMALHDNRHIIEIALTAISKDVQMENIMSLSEINGIPIDRDRIIMMFDEIDTSFDIDRNKKEDKSGDGSLSDFITNAIDAKISSKIDDAKNDTDDKHDTMPRPNADVVKGSDLSFGKILSKFDGIFNYNKLIIVALTNHIEKLDEALYRDLRLTPMLFEEAEIQYVLEIITKFFPEWTVEEKHNTTLSMLKIMPAKLVCCCDTFIGDDINEFIEVLIKSINMSTSHKYKSSRFSGEVIKIAPKLNEAFDMGRIMQFN